jgi:hypothetical protein
VPGREPDGWIELSNFSPGIITRFGYQPLNASTGYGQAPDGAAAINTFRCIALPGGGLGPLPGTDWTYARPSISSDVTAWRTQFCVQGPIGLATSIFDPRSTSATHPVDFILAFEGVGSTGPNTRRIRYTRDRVWQDGATVTHVDTLVTVDSSANAPFQLNYNPTFLIPHATTFTLPTLGPGTLFGRVPLTDSGSPLIANSYLWPDPTSAATAQTASPFNITTTGRCLSHQGRWVIFQRGQTYDGPASAYRWVNGDLFTMTQPGNLTLESSTASVVTQDTFTGLGVVASINASDMLLISHTGGATLVQGDLANPTVRRMPGAIPTGGTSCIGVQTPVGYVYGVNRGPICAWQGETSKVLSAQLAEDSWVVGGHNILEYQGRFALWENWILCPNNWLYDIDTSSWWRIEDPSVSAFYEWMVSPLNGYVYGNVPTWTDGGSQMSGNIKGYNRTTGASSWQWTSQLIARTRNRTLDLREIELAARGAGSVTVNVFSRDQQSNTGFTFPLSGVNWDTQYFRASVPQSTLVVDAVVQIVATGSGGTSTAPTVYAVKIGYNERMHYGSA